jgi:adenosylcobalamin-dependent ribonucleoside-triphosphate reductase
VVSGNVRRTAEIVFGEADNEEYLDLKNYEVNPHRETYGWTSNNSIYARIGMDYRPSAERVRINGEPGYAWLDNMREYGRMADAPNWKDKRASGGNPCLEQTLESHELCCLVETFPTNHESLEDYLTTLQYAYLYAKTVTLGQTHWPETNRVMLRNRRIGCSMSGIAQFIANRGVGELKTWMDTGYRHIEKLDEKYSDWMAIPRSIKTTSIKPSGTVSLLAGSTPGIHFPESRYYIRRMRLGINSTLVPSLEKAGYKIEPAFGSETTTVVVEIPVDVGEGVRTLDSVSMWEQLSLAALAQRYWADNQVSCTVTFDPESEGTQIASALDVFQYQLKGISFLPRLDLGAYPQMPYESIDADTYHNMKSSLGKLNFGRVKGEEIVVERFCDNDVCEIDFNAEEPPKQS